MSTVRVDFTRGAAERIASVVRTVERGNRDEAPLRFTRVPDVPIGNKLGTFEADWPTGQTQVVTLYNVTTLPNTLTAINLSCPIIGFTNSDYTAQFVIVSRAKGTAESVAVELQELEGCLFVAGFDMSRIANYKPGEVQILGHTDNSPPCLKWYDIYTCPPVT